MSGFNGVAVTRRGESIFIPLPRSQWQVIEGTEGCQCEACSKLPASTLAYWDTLAVASKKTRSDTNTTWMIHAPELQDGYAQAVYAEQVRRDDAERAAAQEGFERSFKAAGGAL